MFRPISIIILPRNSTIDLEGLSDQFVDVRDSQPEEYSLAWLKRHSQYRLGYSIHIMEERSDLRFFKAANLIHVGWDRDYTFETGGLPSVKLNEASLAKFLADLDSWTDSFYSRRTVYFCDGQVMERVSGYV
jgi:hypothetical protein